MGSCSPVIRVHKSTKQYVVYHGGKRHYLGPWAPTDRKPPQSVQVAFATLVGRIYAIAEDVPNKPDFWQRSLTVAELAEGFLNFVQQDRPKDLSRWRCYLRPLLELFADWPLTSFGPARLIKVQDRLVSLGHSRTGTDHTIGKIRQVFSWGVCREFVKPEQLVALRTVPGVRHGRAVEKKARGKVADSIVIETLPHLPPRIRVMVQVQRLTGMRPSEVCLMTMGQIDRSKPVWWFNPDHHKTAHHDQERRIPLGPKVQEILGPWLRADPDRPLFSPAESLKEWQDSRRKKKNKPAPNPNRKRPPGEQYTSNRYGFIIREACKKNAIPVWSPNQLRKSAAQAVVEMLDEDHARALLGHTTSEITRQHYLTQEMVKAERAALKIG